jgi:hypothetical protein
LAAQLGLVTHRTFDRLAENLTNHPQTHRTSSCLREAATSDKTDGSVDINSVGEGPLARFDEKYKSLHSNRDRNVLRKRNSEYRMLEVTNCEVQEDLPLEITCS